jgi:hypothetical protein
MTGCPVIFPGLTPGNHERDQAEIVAGSTFTPAPCVDEMAIFLR